MEVYLVAEGLVFQIITQSPSARRTFNIVNRESHAGLTNRDQGEGAWPELVDEAQGAELRGVSLIDDDSVDVAVIRTEQEQDCVDAIKAAIDDNQYGEARSKMSNLRNRVVSKRGDSVTEIGFEEEDRIAGESSFPVVIDAASPRFDSCFGILDQ